VLLASCETAAVEDDCSLDLSPRRSEIIPGDQAGWLRNDRFLFTYAKVQRHTSNGDFFDQNALRGVGDRSAIPETKMAAESIELFVQGAGERETRS
jgi:hypothetical protein